LIPVVNLLVSRRQRRELVRFFFLLFLFLDIFLQQQHT